MSDELRCETDDSSLTTPRYTGLVKIVAFFGALTLLIVGLGTLLYRSSGPADEEARVAAENRPADALLSERLAIAYGALRDAAGTRRLPEAHRYARVAIDAIVGPTGRHGGAGAPPGGILPEDADRITREPGLALRAYDAAPSQSLLRAALDERVAGGIDGWRTPRTRYDAIDWAVAEYSGEQDTVSALPGASERALAWALLTLQAQDVREAHTLAGNGARAARQALDAVRVARAAGQ